MGKFRIKIEDLAKIMSDVKTTNSEKMSILLSVGANINKTTPDNLFKIYNLVDKPNKKPNELKLIEAFLIENGKIETEKKKETLSTEIEIKE